MPSYRPKSLEELNNMYDKKLAAESAMRKGSSHIKDESAPLDTTPPVYEPYTYDSSKHHSKTEEPPVTDITGAVNEFIKTFGQPEEKRAAPQTIHPIQTRVTSKKIPSAPPAHAKAATPVKKKNPSPAAKKQERPVLVRNDERSELMDDYKKIMMDEDEDKVSLKERLAIKKKSKAEKKEADKADKATKKAQKKAAAEVKKVQHIQAAATDENRAAAVDQATEAEQTNQPAAEPVIIQAEEISAIAESFINENIGTKEAEEEQFVQESYYTEQESAQYEEQYVQQYEAENEEVQQYEQSYNDESETDAENYTEPDYAVQQSYEEQQSYDDGYEQQEVFESFAYDKDVKQKSKGSGKAGRVISLMLVIVMLLLTAFTGALKYFVNIDTGKMFMDKYYVFTAKERLLSAGISVGDLVISEEKAVGSEDAFVYFDNTSFRFAKPSDISSANSYVIIAENDNEQVLASSENVRGVVKFTVPFIGRILGFVASNFMIVFISLAALCLVLIIITAILFAKGRKRQVESAYSIDDEYDDEDYGYEAPQDNNAEESCTDEASSEAYSDEEYENDSLPMENEHYFSDEPDDMDERAYLPDQSGQEIQAELISEYPEQQEASEETVYELDDEEE